MSEIKKGDYVLATKWSDGDPYDQWCVGFYDGMIDGTDDRHLVINNDGRQFRRGGFRRVEKIDRETGDYLLSIGEEKMILSGSIWQMKRDFEEARND